MNRQRIDNLDPREYEHPLDKKALDALCGTPGADILTRKFIEYGIEKIYTTQYLGSNLRVTKKSMPHIYDIFENAKNILNLPIEPELYVEWNYEINAGTIGISKPLIILNSGSIDLLSDDELLFIMGHEIGHIKSQHMLYHMMSKILPRISEIIEDATLGIGGIFTTAIQLSLLYWYRMSEFTADRAGLLACQDKDIAIKCMIKAAGLPLKYFPNADIDEFITQAKQFQALDFDTLNKVAKFIVIADQDHPWTVMRAAELIRWIDSGEYSKVRDRNTQVYQTNCIKYCVDCGATIKGNDIYCTNCGHKV